MFCFWMFLGLFLFGAEHCSPSDVLIGLPWGPCPSPPAGENHPPHPGEESLLWKASLPPWAALSACQLLKDPSTAPLTLARHCPPGTTSFPYILHDPNSSLFFLVKLFIFLGLSSFLVRNNC